MMESDGQINKPPQQRLKERAAEIMQHNENMEKLSLAMADLENDFEYVKELNATIADKYDFVTKHLPSPDEIDLLLEKVERADRRDCLRSLRKICVALQTNKPFVNIDQQRLTGDQHATQ